MKKKGTGEGLLSQIESPCQLRNLSIQELQELAQEIRERIIGTVASNWRAPRSESWSS